MSSEFTTEIADGVFCSVNSVFVAVTLMDSISSSASFMYILNFKVLPDSISISCTKSSKPILLTIILYQPAGSFSKLYFPVRSVYANLLTFPLSIYTIASLTTSLFFLLITNPVTDPSMSSAKQFAISANAKTIFNKITFIIFFLPTTNGTSAVTDY